MRYLLTIGVFAAALVSTPAFAVPVANGTVTVADLYVPAINLSSVPATFTATLGNTFEVVGSGGFASVTGLTGVMNGTLAFSSTVGTTIDQSVANFFTFNDGKGGTYNFSPSSVTTQSFSNTPGVSTSIGLYVLGSTLDAALGLSSTPTSLTLSFDSTGGSPYASSATLAIPPAGMTGAVPEPATWGMMIGGLGLAGMSLRRRRTKTKVNFVTA